MKRRVALFPVLLGLCTAVAAQEKTDSTDLFYQHLELQEVVVTGLTGDTRLREMPSPVSVVMPADLRTTASANIISAIATQPGVAAITTGSGIAKPVIRGLGYNRVVVIHDGVRQEGQQWGDEHGIEVDGAGVHSVEILKGPASLMYGSDALAGVVIFHSAPVAPPGTLRAEASAEYQSNNGLAGYSLDCAGNRRGVVWDLRFTDRRAHAYRNRYDGYVPNSGFAERSAAGMVGLNRQWGYSRLRVSYFHQTPGIVEGERDPETGALLGNAVGYRTDLPFQQVYHYKAVLDNTFRLPTGNLKALVGWQRNVRQEFEESSVECGLHFRLDTWNYDIRYQAETGSGWKFAVDVGGMAQRSDNLGTEYLIPAYRLFDAGLFATASRAFGAWQLTGGLRGDLRRLHSEALEEDGALRFTDFRRTFSGFTGSIGAVRSFGDGLRLRLNLARGFRAPNLAELGSNGEHEGTFRYEVGNPDLLPEYSLQGDAGLDFSSPYVSGQVALFANRIDHYIYLARTAGDGDLPVYAYEAGDARLLGFEAALDFHPIHSIHIGSTFSYVDGKQIGGDRLPMIPAPRGTVECKWEFTHDGRVFNNSFVAFHVEGCLRQDRVRSADGTETPTPGYVLIGASAGTDLIIGGKKRATLCIVADNLADTPYQSHLSRLKYAAPNVVTGRLGIYDMGRNITLKLIIPVLSATAL